MVVYSTSPEVIPLPGPRMPGFSPWPVRDVSSTRHLYQEIEKFVEMETLTPSAGDTTAPGVKRSESETALPLAIHAERFRSRTPLGNEAEQVSSLAFYMDKGLGYIPALHCGYRPSDARACASLDFSLRLFDHELDIQNWHVTEQKSVVANNARAYSEGRVWDSNGRLLACMTQQTTLRPNSATTSHI